MIERSGQQLHLTVIKPPENTAEALRAVRASVLRAGIAKIGLWTVETGEKFAGLHLNIISTAPNIPPDMSNMSWSEAITTSARVAAAYISKQSGMPDEKQYAGRLWGKFGNVTEIIATGQAPVLLRAGAIETQLSGKVQKLAPWERQHIEKISTVSSRKSHAEYVAIARRHIPHVWAMVEAERSKRAD